MIESIQQVHEAVRRAQREIYRADESVRLMADLCAGKLQVARVSGPTLKALKRELARYNIHTGRWGEK